MIKEMKTSTDIVYHYTDMNALVNILRKEHIILRATNCLYLNDTHEIIEGVTAIERVLKIKIGKDTFKNHYITSFSQNQDSLSMWGMYAANGQGCAIGLRNDLLSKSYSISIKCIYGESEIDKNLTSFLKLTQTGCITQMDNNIAMKKQNTVIAENRFRLMANNILLLSTCLGSKNAAYKEEKETRYIVECDNNNVVKFRIKNGVIIPFVEIIISKEALDCIIIGPTNNYQFTKDSIQNFLLLNGFDLNHVEIISSKIPYRG